MSTIESMGYAIKCDYPGCETKTGDLGDYGFWGSAQQAADEWQECDGYSGDLVDTCSEHTIWADVYDADNDDRMPMPFTLQSEFHLAMRRIVLRGDLLAWLACSKLAAMAAPRPPAFVIGGRALGKSAHDARCEVRAGIAPVCDCAVRKAWSRS